MDSDSVVLLLKTSGEVSIVLVPKEPPFILFLQSLINDDIFLHSIQLVTSQAVHPCDKMFWIIVTHADAFSDHKMPINPFSISPHIDEKIRGDIIICVATDTTIYPFKLAYLNLLPPRIRISISNKN